MMYMISHWFIYPTDDHSVSDHQKVILCVCHSLWPCSHTTCPLVGWTTRQCETGQGVQFRTRYVSDKLTCVTIHISEIVLLLGCTLTMRLDICHLELSIIIILLLYE